MRSHETNVYSVKKINQLMIGENKLSILSDKGISWSNRSLSVYKVMKKMEPLNLSMLGSFGTEKDASIS